MHLYIWPCLNCFITVQSLSHLLLNNRLMYLYIVDAYQLYILLSWQVSSQFLALRTYAESQASECIVTLSSMLFDQLCQLSCKSLILNYMIIVLWKLFFLLLPTFFCRIHFEMSHQYRLEKLISMDDRVTVDTSYRL